MARVISRKSSVRNNGDFCTRDLSCNIARQQISRRAPSMLIDIFFNNHIHAVFSFFFWSHYDCGNAESSYEKFMGALAVVSGEVMRALPWIWNHIIHILTFSVPQNRNAKWLQLVTAAPIHWRGNNSRMRERREERKRERERERERKRERENLINGISLYYCIIDYRVNLLCLYLILSTFIFYI